MATTTWFVSPPSERPDFRLVVAYLWGDMHTVDSDGDSDNPASREWTWLYLQNRAAPTQVLDIDADDESTSIFKVESDVPGLAAAAAYFLARELGASVRRDLGDEPGDADTLVDHAAPFDVEAGTLRARKSVWRRATLAYPNARPR